MSGSNVGAKGLCAVIDTNGTVLPCVATDNGDGTATLKIDSELTATIDPTGLATSANQVALQAISDLVDLGGAQRLVGSGASQALIVPANTLIMRVDAEGGAVRISHTGAASATTIPRVPEEAIDYIPLKSTDAPEFYGASVSVIANINYYGART